jgi:hypothetical protein
MIIIRARIYMHLNVLFRKFKLIVRQYVHDMAYCRLNKTFFFFCIFLYILNIIHIIAHLQIVENLVNF